MYHGQSAFSIFFDNEKILEYLVEKVLNLELGDNPKVYRYLFSNLITPVNQTKTLVSMQ